MSNITIYKNGELAITTGFSKDYEKTKRDIGVYSPIGLMLKILESKPELQNKIFQQQDFVLSKEEKDIISKKMEEYIDRDIHNFKEADETEVYKSIVYKSKTYKAPFKRSYLSLEKKLMPAISLYNLFNDPNDSDVVEFKFD
ncbi:MULTISPECIES: hypothetical protein [Chryseobacterium]|uniref:Uncharacterized protein n=1 Tax=Chryseobacterium mucoviscidosis TaxID=1945581 RepID=A0A202BTR3_9FLAO|nr:MULTISPECIES: hypothetical protein [Chryseobacterium]MCY1659385.1 hypothetical protein [Chryseobacterium sp. SL1]OVE54752.1 hypothetical protein B0E34_18185 [Chryseobacterium mucoviscidosis]